MQGRVLIGSHEDKIEGNIYADKSSLILEWLLRVGIKKKDISIREATQEIGVSIGLVQRTFSALVHRGFMRVKGVRTAKKFFFKNPRLLLESWLKHYDITKKCKIRNYRTALSGKDELLKALQHSGFNQKVVLALHSAADAHGYKNTNLDTLELYLLEPSIRNKLESILQLEPQERGYEVLLIEPYYKALVKQAEEDKDIRICPILLTFLDLSHFPLRGQEQAEFIAKRAPEIKQIYSEENATKQRK